MKQTMPGGLQHDDGTKDFAVMHGLEGGLDIVEADAAADDFIKLEFSLEVQVAKQWKVAGGEAIAVPGNAKRAA